MMQPTRPSLPLIFLALALAEVVAALEISMIYTALPSLIRVFEDPVRPVWVITAHFLVGAAAAAVCGRLGDMYGHRRVLLIVLCICGGGSLVSALSDGLLPVIVGRGLQGVGAAVIPLCFGVVRANVPKERIAQGIAIVATVPTAAGGLGFLAGGVLVEHYSWRAIFDVSAALAIVAALLVWKLVPGAAAQRPRKAIDVAGGLLFIVGIVGVMFSVAQGRSWGWTDPRLLGCLGPSIAVLIVWAFHESRRSNPLIDVRLFGNRQIALANLCMILLSLSGLQNVQLFSLLLQQPPSTGVGFGIAPTLLGLVLLPTTLLYIVGGPLGGRVARLKTARVATTCAGMLIGFGYAGLLFDHHDFWFAMAMMYVQVLGNGMMFAAIPILIVEAAPPDRTGEATGIASVMRQIAMGVGSQMLALALASSTASGPGGVSLPSPHAYVLSLGIAFGISLLLVLTAYALPRRRPAPAATGLAVKV